MSNEHGEAPDLRELWQRWARRATDTQLAALVAVSVALFIAYAVLIAFDARAALRWWPAMVAPIVAGAFGTWAIADREQRDRTARATQSGGRALAGLKLASAIAAGLGAAAGVIAFLRVTVGTWIS
jgi:ABC-type nitrate/sulfonate/bicarbonate transport system permease component